MKKQPSNPLKPYQIAPDEDQMLLASMGATYPALPAMDILNTAEIRRDDDPPPLMHQGKRVLPIGIGDPYAPFDFS